MIQGEIFPTVPSALGLSFGVLTRAGMISPVSGTMIGRISCPVNFDLVVRFVIEMHRCTIFLLILLNMIVLENT